jgi:hypothetical protein
MKHIRLDRCAGVAVAAAAIFSTCVSWGATITVLGTVTSDGYIFTNFDGPAAGTAAGAGTNINGISNTGVGVGYDISNNGNFSNFTANPPASNTANLLNIGGSTNAMAFGINSTGTVGGGDGIGDAFFLSGGTVNTFIPTGGSAATAFGINDLGTIVGQYTTAVSMPGFIRTAANSYITIDAPSGPNVVDAQGINNSGLIAGFYLGNDGQNHGFLANQSGASGGSVTGVAVADPTIPSVPGEPGATFVFSQLLGINDSGTVAGYYGDSTTSQHGFLYDSNTGRYTFLDDPAEAFNNGVEVTQITGINNAGDLSGFYSDSNGVFHGFIATPVPEPGSIVALGVLGSVMLARRRANRSGD